LKSRIAPLRRNCGIGWAWGYLSLPGKPGKGILSPFREEKKPSFSVYLHKDGHEVWWDAGINKGGDVVDFWMEAKQCSLAQAIQELEAICGMGFAEPPTKYVAAQPGEPFVWPADFSPPGNEDCRAIAKLRGLPEEAFHLAGLLGTLLIGRHPRTKQWLWWITDCRRCGLEGRTFSGEPCLDSGQKCTAYPGSDKSWAYGLQTNVSWLDKAKNAVLVEGGPDYFAALAMAINSPISFTVMTMLGAGPRIGKEALEAMRGRHVIILPHNDQGGATSSMRWREALLANGCWVTMQPLQKQGDKGEPIKDVNDLVRLQTPETINLYLEGFLDEK
jgi:CHC2-type zinc finger protein